MIFHEIPYQMVKWLFDPNAAEQFNRISLILTAIGFVIAVILGRKISFKLKSRPPRYYDQDTQEPQKDKIYTSRKGKWSPTGWFYNADKQRWEPPEYLSEESHKKWKWNEEKQIWVDIEKEERLKRYRENRKAMGMKPTYEEWKAERELQNKEAHPE